MKKRCNGVSKTLYRRERNEKRKSKGELGSEKVRQGEGVDRGDYLDLLL
jgi:hypothetical protein